MARTPVTAPWRSAVLFVALLPALLAAAGRAEDSPLLAELVALTERIEEAVRTGDRATLERLSLPEMRLVNRDGKSYSQRDCSTTSCRCGRATTCASQCSRRSCCTRVTRPCSPSCSTST